MMYLMTMTKQQRTLSNLILNDKILKKKNADHKYVSLIIDQTFYRTNIEESYIEKSHRIFKCYILRFEFEIL